MDDFKDWFRAKVRLNVMSKYMFTDEFNDWRNNCSGAVMAKPVSNYERYVSHVYFENEEDLVNYLLTFDPLPEFDFPRISTWIIDG